MKYEMNVPFSSLGNKIAEIFGQIDRKVFTSARWFREKGSTIMKIDIKDYDIIKSPADNQLVIPLVVEFTMTPGENGVIYYIPVILSRERLSGRECWLELQTADGGGAYLYDAVNCKEYVSVLQKEMKADMAGGGRLENIRLAEDRLTSVERLTEVSSNSLSVGTKKQVIKTYRQLTPGTSIDVELGLKLQRESDFDNLPKIYGYLQYYDERNTVYTLNKREEFIDVKDTLWTITVELLDDYLASEQEKSAGINFDGFSDYLNDYLQEVEEVGILIADLHLALSRLFPPEVPTASRLRQWVQERREAVRELCVKLQENCNSDSMAEIKELLTAEEKLINIFAIGENYRDRAGKFIRIHGDLHLEQILSTGDKFYILDFEGEPLKDISRRRKRYSPLKDIAGIFRSFDYAVRLSCRENGIDACVLPEFLRKWKQRIEDKFLKAYRQRFKSRDKQHILPPAESMELLLALYRLEKSIYEARYELENRPGWIALPLAGVRECLKNLECLYFCC